MEEEWGDNTQCSCKNPNAPHRFFHICCLVQLGVFCLCVVLSALSLKELFLPPHFSFPREGERKTHRERKRWRGRRRRRREAGASSLEQAWQNLNYRSSTAKRRGSRGRRDWGGGGGGGVSNVCLFLCGRERERKTENRFSGRGCYFQGIVEKPLHSKFII